MQANALNKKFLLVYCYFGMKFDKIILVGTINVHTLNNQPSPKV